MMTFEEAFQKIIRKTNGLEPSQQDMEALADNMGRYRDILVEVSASPAMKEFVLLITCMADELSPEKAIMTTFVNGLMIGLEMNRVEMD